MAVTLTGTSSGSQGLFNRLGVLGGALNDVNTARAAMPTALADAMALYDGASTTLRAPIEGLIASMKTSQAGNGSYLSAIKAAAAKTLIEMFDADSPLSKRDVETALDRLRTQMLTATTTYVDANTVSASVTATSLTGNGNVVTSTKDGLGRNLENLLAEIITITCTSNTTSGSELIRFRGEEALTDKLSQLWPLGSGVDRTLTSLSAASTNLISGGAFETFTTANTPDGWTIATGTAGTHVFSESSTVYAGSKALKMAGNGSTLTKIQQAITGLSAQTPYAINFYCKASGTPAAGVLTVDLYDGSSVIADEAGTNNSFTVDLTTLGTSYVAKSGVFRLPDPVPSTVYLRVYQSTALSNTYNLFIDHMAMQAMTRLDASNAGYAPYVAVFGGSTGWSTDDGLPGNTTVWKITSANDRASQWQELFDKFFDTGKSGYLLPVSGTTLINDSLIA